VGNHYDCARCPPPRPQARHQIIGVLIIRQSSTIFLVISAPTIHRPASAPADRLRNAAARVGQPAAAAVPPRCKRSSTGNRPNWTRPIAITQRQPALCRHRVSRCKPQRKWQEKPPGPSAYQWAGIFPCWPRVPGAQRSLWQAISTDHCRRPDKRHIPVRAEGRLIVDPFSCSILQSFVIFSRYRRACPKFLAAVVRQRSSAVPVIRQFHIGMASSCPGGHMKIQRQTRPVSLSIRRPSFRPSSSIECLRISSRSLTRTIVWQIFDRHGSASLLSSLNTQSNTAGSSCSGVQI